VPQALRASEQEEGYSKELSRGPPWLASQIYLDLAIF
jgi:hypothetical protein